MADSKMGSNNFAAQEALIPDAATPWPDQVPATADASVDALLGPLLDLPNAPVASHQEVFAQVYDALNAELNTEPGTGPSTNPGAQPSRPVAKPGGNA